MDLMYFESPPGLQFLHSLTNSTKGGESIFADTFKAVEMLQKVDPKAIDILKNTFVTFHYNNNGQKRWFHRPTIVLENEWNEPLQVNYSPPFQAPLQIPVEKVHDFYTAFAKFEEILYLPELVYKTRLEPGDVVIFANRRVVHGREAFDPSSGQRHFKGTYVDWDDFKNQLGIHGLL